MRTNKLMKRYMIGRFRYWVGMWSYGISVGGDYQRGEGTILSMWCFKMVDLPPQGEMLKRGRDYKGFNWSIAWKFQFYFYKP